MKSMKAKKHDGYCPSGVGMKKHQPAAAKPGVKKPVKAKKGK